jgi:hypothetical protein
LGASFSSPSSSPCEKAVDTLVTTLILTTAGPYFCTMALKSGSVTVGVGAVEGVTALAPVAAGAAAAVVATARVTPIAYSVPTGTAMVAAPSTAAMSGFLMSFNRFISLLRSILLRPGTYDRQCGLWEP